MIKMKIGIVGDSSSGLSATDLTEMNIGFCPLLITFSDNTTIEDISSTFNNEQFYNKITKENQTAKTSQTPIGKIKKVWKEALTKFEKIIFIPLSKGLSGQYNTASMLAQTPLFKDKVFVFDSNGVSIINWLLIKKAYQMSLIENNDITTIIEALEIIRDNYLAFILPFDLSYLVRGGRISKTAAALAKFGKITPILSFDGTIDKFDKTRTWKKAINHTLKEINKIKKFKNISLFYIVHAFAQPAMITEVQKYVNNCGIKNVKTVNLANVICTHTGIGTFSFICFDLEKDRLPQLT